ncbi:partitioning defective 3 related [Holotrichia oblita]|uniref:Partitioning defective 3 related n=1 Tax=Holotrichia oblita TaxID=644536 RepID=A0ACB9T2P0_HOLOL|nr:partitioning defective 3 related [Holotrichia oblita]
MFDNCQTTNANPKCSEVAEKIVQIFGWRHTYNVEKLQRNVPGRETTRISITRPTTEYIKSNVQSPESWVSVHNLQSQGGGILDPDDRLSDVADDREQILASFEDGDGAHHHGGGDGASGSSVGTGSPDIFHDGDLKYCASYPRTDIEVTGEQLASGCPGSLQVRRGSEPALNQLPIGPPPPNDHNKRWSAAPIILEPPNISFRANDWSEDSREEDEEPGFKRITRDGSNRLSMQFLGDGIGYRWAEAAERANSRSHTSLPRENKRKEPLGQANSTSPVYGLDNRSELIVIRNELGPLGIHVVPDYDTSGKDKGLLVQGIEPGGRIDRDGRLAVFDRIIEINGQNLLNMPFQRHLSCGNCNFRVQELFKLSLTSPELRLRVIRSSNSIENFRKPPAPVYPKFPDDKENVSIMAENEQKQSTNAKVATVSPTKKIPGVSRNLKSLLQANTRKIGRKIEIELTKGQHGLGFSITTRDNPAGGNCPIYIKNIIPKGAAVEDGRLRIGDRLLEVNGVEMTGKSQAEAVAVLRNAPTGSKVKIVVSRQEDVTDMNLPRIIGVDESVEKEEEVNEATRDENMPPTIPPLPQSHLQLRSPDKNNAVSKIISQFQEAANTSNPPEKTDDSSQFPWKHKEILTFNIPVHDSEKAGLGISVKGKTSSSQDLGIFIKSVIHGGAASRDKRLKTNDQLLNVNGISLLQQSNSDAMETLRKAMCHTEGPVPGNITLTIARRASSPGPNRNFTHKQSDSIHNHTGMLLLMLKYKKINKQPSLTASELCQINDSEPSTTDNSGASVGSTNTVIFNPNKSVTSSKSITSQATSPMNTWNPVLDRLMGNKNQQLRNESYYRATHDTWNATMFVDRTSPNVTTTTVNLPSGEPILIEDEYGSRVLPQQISRTKITLNPMNTTVNATNGIESRNEHEPDGKASLSGSNCDKSTESSQVTGNDATYASQLSLENPAGFSRDAFGRQSMSEKRHATLDAKNTDTYQRTKKLREERDKNKNLEDADKLGQLGPSLGMKKSSSLESLQTMVQEMQMQEEGDPAYSYRGASGGLKVIRGKGCEESFRAAVVDPNHRSEITAKKHWLLDPPVDEREIDGFSNVRGGPRQSSLNAAIDGKHKVPKKKPGIFKGIGSMFRFGKHRKMESEVPQHYQQTTEFDSDQVQLYKTSQDATADMSHATKQSDNQNHNIPNERVREYEHREPLYQRHGFVHHHAEQVQVIPEGTAVTSSSRYSSSSQSVDHNQNRGDRMKLHHPRHTNRHNTYYAPEDRESHYEQRNDQTSSKYGEYGRPGSRSGITDSVPFTHYVNYNELQNHISRKQHQYHSQRQPRQDNQLRPVSNYYEYETVQSVLNSRGVRQGIQPPIHPPPYQDPNSNSLTRQQVQGRSSASRSHHTQHRGPFVTHVTIGDHSQQNGTKV